MTGNGKAVRLVKALMALAWIGGARGDAGAPSAAAWSFGVMGDTQWTCPTDPAGDNPGHVPKSIIDQVNAEFIRAGVKFVIQVGDLTEFGGDADLRARAAAAQALLDAGIGFFPVRGNHEISALPPGTNGYGSAQFRTSFPQTRGLTNAFGAVHFSSPATVGGELDGLSYAFDYGAAGNTATNPAMQNAFFASLQDNGVRYYVCGHDHIHQRSLIASPDGRSRVTEVICASDSSKFYAPRAVDDVGWAGQKARETSLSQEQGTVGYYLYTVDGPRVTADYYADDHGQWQSDSNFPCGYSAPGNQITPRFRFAKKETFGYSLNGHRYRLGRPQPRR